MVKFEEMLKLEPGDLLLADSPLLGEEVFVIVAIEDNVLYCQSSISSIILNSQEVINSFNVRPIDNTHPKWNLEMHTYGKKVGEIMKGVTFE